MAEGELEGWALGELLGVPEGVGVLDECGVELWLGVGFFPPRGGVTAFGREPLASRNSGAEPGRSVETTVLVAQIFVPALSRLPSMTSLGESR